MTPTALRTWTEALTARIARDGPVPVRYTQRLDDQVLAAEGHVMEAFYWSPLDIKLPRGVPKDTLLLHVRTPLCDGPLQWEGRDLSRPSPHVLEPIVNDQGSTWKLEVLEPEAALRPPFSVVLLRVQDGAVLYMATEADDTIRLPGGEVLPEDGDVWVEPTKTVQTALLRHLRRDLQWAPPVDMLTEVQRAPFLGEDGITRVRVVYTTTAPLPDDFFLMPVDTYLGLTVSPAEDAQLFLHQGLFTVDDVGEEEVATPVG